MKTGQGIGRPERMSVQNIYSTFSINPSLPLLNEDLLDNDDASRWYSAGYTFGFHGMNLIPDDYNETRNNPRLRMMMEMGWKDGDGDKSEINARLHEQK